jgi:hypothetical protein
MKYWELIADNLHAAGWPWGLLQRCLSTGWYWIVDAHRGGQRYIVHSDELLSASLELEARHLTTLLKR